MSLNTLLTNTEALERAYVYWRMTHLRVPIEEIQGQQRSAGYEPCFGRALLTCRCTDCKWYDLCMRLARTPQVGEASWLDLQDPGEA